MEILTPVKSKTLEQIDTQFVRIDYVHERNVCSKFDKNLFTWGLLGKEVKYNFLCHFIFFSDQRREETPGRILTRNGSKDAESCKDVPFWGYKMKNWNLNPIYPQNPKNLALNRQFPAKMMKHETPSISESTEPIEMKI